jgi:hypothetical protein
MVVPTWCRVAVGEDACGCGGTGPIGIACLLTPVATSGFIQSLLLCVRVPWDDFGITEQGKKKKLQ